MADWHIRNQGRATRFLITPRRSNLNEDREVSRVRPAEKRVTDWCHNNRAGNLRSWVVVTPSVSWDRFPITQVDRTIELLGASVIR